MATLDALTEALVGAALSASAAFLALRAAAS
jgi:hypothetical protein